MENLPNISNMPDIPVDFIILATILYTIYSGFKRGFFRESLIAIAYVPYMAAMFYIVNEFIQGNYEFDSIIYKASSFGGFYIAYLFVVWGVSKSLNLYFKKFDETIIYIGKFIAGIISGLRTVYFCILCLIAFNIHINQPQMLEKSKLATAAQPLAQKIQDFLLNKGYIDYEITIYEEAVNGTFNDNGKYEHPLMKKIKSSDKFKEIEKSIDRKKLEKQMQQYMNSYPGM